jgi:hypothetical protein
VHELRYVIVRMRWERRTGRSPAPSSWGATRLLRCGVLPLQGAGCPRTPCCQTTRRSQNCSSLVPKHHGRLPMWSPFPRWFWTGPSVGSAAWRSIRPWSETMASPAPKTPRSVFCSGTAMSCRPPSSWTSSGAKPRRWISAQGVTLVDQKTGEPVKTWVFVMTLAFSRHQYVEFVLDQRVKT